jgi:hypothetical protein
MRKECKAEKEIAFTNGVLVTIVVSLGILCVREVSRHEEIQSDEIRQQQSDIKSLRAQYEINQQQLTELLQRISVVERNKQK